MVTTAPVDALFDLVPVFGVMLGRENLPAVIAAVAAIIAAAIGASVGLKKLKVERSNGVVASFEKLLDAEREARKQDKADWEKKFSEQAQQLTALTEKVGNLEFTDSTNRRTIRLLEDENYDLREDQKDLRAYVIDVERHRARDYGPPPPEPSWRIERLLAKARDEGLL